MGKILRGIQKFVCQIHKKNNDELKYYFKSELLKDRSLTTTVSGVSQDKIADAEVVVSLTTYGKRLYEVYLTIESIMQGTLRPNRIVLWLAEDIQYDDIPFTLKMQERRGLEIGFTKDIRSFKKLIPTLKKYPDSIIITIDDDAIYEPDLVENLLISYKKASHFIYGNRVKQIIVDKNLMPFDYRRWNNVENGTEPSVFNISIGVGGVLYPPHCFTDEVFNEEKFMTLCPTADDLWFWYMAKFKGYNTVKAYTHDKIGNDFIVNPGVQDVALTKTNVSGGAANNIQLMKIISNYGNNIFMN